jgi:hypothetical protein
MICCCTKAKGFLFDYHLALPSACLPVCLPVCLSACLPVCLSACLSICRAVARHGPVTSCGMGETCGIHILALKPYISLLGGVIVGWVIATWLQFGKRTVGIETINLKTRKPLTFIERIQRELLRLFLGVGSVLIVLPMDFFFLFSGDGRTSVDRLFGSLVTDHDYAEP